jgi:hypothetical protein
MRLIDAAGERTSAKEILQRNLHELQQASVKTLVEAREF